ncbi:cyclic-di-AMP receptor [soil metagenome]
MKLIVAIAQDYDTDALLRAVTTAGFRVTRVSSTGGFLRSTNATLLIGVEDHQVKTCLEIIHDCCATRFHAIDASQEESWLAMDGGEIIRDAHGGAVVLILTIERLEKLYSIPEAAPSKPA